MTSGSKRWRYDVVAVLILNWRNYALTQQCLRHLANNRSPLKLYVIDNESEPSSFQALLQEFPQVSGLGLSTNLGYPAAMNKGVQKALEEGATSVLLLNNDVELRGDSLDRLLDCWNQQPLNVGLLSPRLCKPDEHTQIEGCGISINLKTGRIRQITHPKNEHSLVQAASGACLLIRKEVFEKIGFLDEDFYFYFEDIDLCLRAQEAGFDILANANVDAHHLGSATIGLSPDRSYYGLRNQLRLLQLRGQAVGPLGQALRPTYLIALHTAQTLREQGLRPKAFFGLWQAAQDHRNRRYGKRSNRAIPQSFLSGSL